MVRPLFIPAFWPRPHPFQVQFVPVRDISQLVWLLYVAVTSLKFPRTAVSLYIRIPKTPRTEPGKNDLHYCQRTTASGDAVYVQREPNGVGLETRYSVGL